MAGRANRKAGQPEREATAPERAEVRARSNDVLRNNGIRWVQVHFTDLLGGLRSFTVLVEDLRSGNIWEDGIGFDGASVKGFAQVESSDMRAIANTSLASL